MTCASFMTSAKGFSFGGSGFWSAAAGFLSSDFPGAACAKSFALPNKNNTATNGAKIAFRMILTPYQTTRYLKGYARDNGLFDQSQVKPASEREVDSDFSFVGLTKVVERRRIWVQIGSRKVNEARSIGHSKVDGGGGRNFRAYQWGLINHGTMRPLRRGNVIHFVAHLRLVEAALCVGFIQSN